MAQDLEQIIAQAARTYNLPPGLLRAVIQVESGGNPRAVSPAGAQGLMQLMPETARGLGVQDPFDPEQNVMGGARYLRQLLDRYGGDLDRALAAYNAGPGAVERYGGIPPYQETQTYVRKVKAAMGAQDRPKEIATTALAGASTITGTGNPVTLIDRLLSLTASRAEAAEPSPAWTPATSPAGLSEAEIDRLVNEALQEMSGNQTAPSQPQAPASNQPILMTREYILKEIAPKHGGVATWGARTDLSLTDEALGRVVPDQVQFNDGTYLLLLPDKSGRGYTIIGGNALSSRGTQTRQIAGATPREKFIPLLTPEGEVQAVPNPNYDEALAEAEKARIRHQAELERIRADLEARRISLEEARQRAEESYRRFQQEAERARLQAMLRGQDIDLARSILNESAGLFRESLRYLAPPGTGEDIARLLDAFRTGQLPEITPRTMKFPFNPRTIGIDLARQVLQAIDQNRPALPVPPRPALPGEATETLPELPPVGGRLSPEPPGQPWPGGGQGDFWGPALQAPRPGMLVPREAASQDFWGPALQAPRPGAMAPAGPAGIDYEVYRDQLLALGTGLTQPVAGGAVPGGAGPDFGRLLQAITGRPVAAPMPMEGGLTPPPPGPRPASMIPGRDVPLLPPVPLPELRRLWEAFATWWDNLMFPERVLNNPNLRR